MLNWIYAALLPKIIGWLTGQAINFDKVVEWVKEAEHTFSSGADKAAWVKEQITAAMKIAIPWILNLLVELAVAYAKKQGWIK